MRAGKARSPARGFSYVLVLLLLMVLGLGLSVAGPRWANEQQRDREHELIRIGHLYGQAIRTYYEASPGSLKQYPPTLDSLLVDMRFVGTRRHLRRLYTDPMRPGLPLEPVLGSDGTIRGVRSTSDLEPFLQDTLRLDGLIEIRPARHYRDWAFTALPST
jgi:type II secretory pathway pseudopilin PulG